MPASRKKTKHMLARLPVPASKKRKRRPSREDLVGKFLLSIFTGFVTALISQAVSNQVNWLLVLVIFSMSLLILVLYQNRP